MVTENKKNYDKIIASLLADGCTNKEVCNKLNISAYKFRQHLKKMYKKYNKTRKIPLILKVLFNKDVKQDAFN